MLRKQWLCLNFLISNAKTRCFPFSYYETSTNVSLNISWHAGFCCCVIDSKENVSRYCVIDFKIYFPFEITFYNLSWFIVLKKEIFMFLLKVRVVLFSFPSERLLFLF